MASPYFITALASLAVCPALPPVSSLHRALWFPSLLIGVTLSGLCVFVCWVFWTDHQRHREREAREAVREQLWAARDPEGYAEGVRRRQEEDALVAATLAAYPSCPWWRRRST